MEWSLWSHYFDLSTKSWSLENTDRLNKPAILAGVDIRTGNIPDRPFIGCYKGKRRRYRECITHSNRTSIETPDNPIHNREYLYPDGNLYGTSCSSLEAKDHIDFTVGPNDENDRQFEYEFANQYDFKRDFNDMSGHISACSKYNRLISFYKEMENPTYIFELQSELSTNNFHISIWSGKCPNGYRCLLRSKISSFVGE